MASASGVGQPPRLRQWWQWQRLREENNRLAKHILARRPEERLINDYAEVRATMRKAATGVAYLMLTWSTVVLLGGFVPVLKLIDFWFLTAVSTAFALNLADLYEYKVAFAYAARNVYIGRSDNLARRFASSCSRGFVSLFVICSVIAETSLVVLLIGGLAVLHILPFIPLVAIVLSLVRLVVHSYGNAGGDAGNAAKLKASLQIFYSLALAQNILFYVWSLFLYYERDRALAVSQQCGFGKWGFGLVRRYLRETLSMCATEGIVPPHRNLITFAVGLLGSESLDDHRSAVRMLDTFIGNQIHDQAGVGVEPNLLHSKDHVEKLIGGLEVGNDGKTRERAARIVVALAGDIRHIDQFPTALDHIASLLQASDGQSSSMPLPSAATRTETTTASMEEDEAPSKRWRNGPLYWFILSCFNIFYGTLPNKQQDDVFPDGEPKLLISQGLRIVERLALHQGNCVHICNNHVLLSKITAPLYSHAFLDAAEHDSEWVDMLGTSLRILASLLIRAPGEATRGLHDRIASNAQAISNLTSILEDQKFGTVLKTPAIDILAQLASSSHNSAMGLLDIRRFISQLWGIFLAGRDEIDNTIEEEEQRQQDSRLRQKAGEALAQMLSVWDAAASSSDILEIFVQSTTPSVTKYKDGGSSSEEVPTAALRHVVGQLTDMLIKSKSPRTMAARILECLCSHPSKIHRELPSQDVIEMLTKVLELILHIPCETNKLEMAVQVKICSPGETNNGTGVGATKTNKSSSKKDEEQQEEKDFLVALLSLAVAICDRMVDAHDFTCAAPQDMVSLVKKLKDILQTNNTTTVECLRTVKLTCQLVVSMVQLKPMCIKEFTEHKFKDVLSESLKILTDLDNCLMLFDVDDHHQVTKTDKPLVSLVKQAQEVFDKAQEPGNVLA